MMKTLSFKPLLAITVLLCGMTSFGQQRILPKGWKEINARGFFTFYMPDRAWQAFQGLDNFYWEYRIGKLAIKFEYEPDGVLSYDKRAQHFGEGFQERVVEIDGKKAYLFEYVHKIRGRKRYYTDLYIGDFPNRKVKLVMGADSWRQADLKIAQEIFRTVKFSAQDASPGVVNSPVFAKTTPEADEYAIYRVVLNELYLGKETYLIINNCTNTKWTTSIPRTLRRAAKEMRKTFSRELQDDFETKNQSRHEFENQFEVTAEIVLLSQREIDRLIGNDWTEF
jgi:hypothetical protein